MKISDQTIGRQPGWTGSSATRTPGHFERILRSRSALKPDHVAKPAAPKNDDGLRQLATLNDVSGPMCMPDLVEPPKAGHLSPLSVKEAGTTGINDLSREILQEIRSRKGADAQSVDIQFDSGTLDGLRVHLSAVDKTLSITFATQSTEVATLLSQHSAQLIDRLRQGGFAINRIGIVRKRPMEPNRSGQREWMHSA